MIEPTVGRVVHYYTGIEDKEDGVHPLAAHVCAVHNDRMVNLLVISQDGSTFGKTSVQLLQQGDPAPQADFCEWMPFQKGQVPASSAIESRVKALEDLVLPNALGRR